MKYLAVIVLALTPLAGLAANLVIPAGKKYVMGIDQQELVLDELRIGDNATITFSSGVSGWRVQARRAFIGDGVVIDGSGSDGVAGEIGREASACSNGEPGANGGDGGDGLAIRLQLGLEALGQIRILSNGGRGGDGGAGSDGSDVSDTCKDGVGGEGGNGGSGGEGGRGGDIALLYKVLSKGSVIGDITNLVRISSEGGDGGSGGNAGSGGEGSEGYYVNKRTLTGNRKWIPGGESGLAGNPGSAGSAGHPGRALLDELILSAEQPKRAEGLSTNTLIQLQRQVENLRIRVEQLEAAQVAE